ncbi:MAG: methyltransferase domain-containing protein [Actinomycetota bacterium]|nr:methyltransferase domain-containing protein [Actinomycetota bacterium]
MDLADLLVCSVCRGELSSASADDGQVQCTGCGRTYRRQDGVYDMTPLPVPDADVADMWSLWEQLQENGAVAYEADPEANLSFGRRRDAELFAEFSNLRGLTLDIGCGPQLAPSYGLDFDGRLVGIDPLSGVQPRKFDFVQGIGEYLPFADGTFDRVLFATSLDHVLVPERVMREARRVVAPDGFVSIWFAEHHHGPPSAAELWRRRARATTTLIRQGDFGALVRRSGAALGMKTESEPPSYMDGLAVPAGAEDHFHAFHLDRDLVGGWIADADLTTIDSRIDDAAGCFVMAKPTG